ncbi:M6 family metalloprotease domain-containing protein [Streptomyces xanthochromogenes]|uniref:M6 family metalloprotease domain-containing protein n=1 Tax=Streptomyces TaxID=1883 RepID=UPI001367DB9D|nr:M6 family metalloprotease domain-containing protein [Streptomyces sp. SID1034]MYV90286.1 M6 family metalloprotease domain-containing protein [Streptomyces sp. SID1034]
MFRIPLPEVDVQRQQTPGGVERVRLRGAVAALTSLTALAAISLVSGPAVAVSSATPCALPRTDAHHSLGVDTWNAAYPRPVRTLNAVMVFLSFPDSKPATAPDDLAADYFPATSRFFEQASYGKFRLNAEPQRRWVRMPSASTSYRIERDWDPAQRTRYLMDAIKAADPTTDFSKYDIVYLVADPDAPGVDSDATKVVNFDRPVRADGRDINRVVTVFEHHPPDRNVLAHETGHVFDLPDLYHRPQDGKNGDWDTYVGDWDVMGSQFGTAPDLFGWQKWKLGWLDRRQVTCVTGDGTSRFTLEPLSASPAKAGLAGKRLAVVRTGEDRAIAIEVRDSGGLDRASCDQGLLVYRVRSGSGSGGGPVEVLDAHPDTEACWERSVYPALADAPVALGETFTVPGEGIRIEAEGRTKSGAWTVKISH